MLNFNQKNRRKISRNKKLKRQFLGNCPEVVMCLYYPKWKTAKMVVSMGHLQTFTLQCHMTVEHVKCAGANWTCWRRALRVLPFPLRAQVSCEQTMSSQRASFKESCPKWQPGFILLL